MKILHVIPSIAPRYGGPSKACLEMASAVAERGHEVHIYSVYSKDEVRERVTTTSHTISGVIIHLFPINRPRFWLASWKYVRAIYRDLPSFDIVNIHSLYLFTSVITPLICRLRGIPYIVRPHGTLTPYIYRRHRIRKALLELLFERRNYNMASAVHFTSEEEKQTCIFDVRCMRIVVPLGLTLDEFGKLPIRGSFRKKHIIARDAHVLLFLSRLSHQKGLDTLVDLFIMVAREDANIFLVVSGPDDEGLWESYNRKLINEGMKGRYIYTGMLQGKDKMEAFVDADIFVLPSNMENFGLVIFEAMAAGLPVLISDKVHLWKEIVKAKAGEALPLSANRFKERIQYLFANPELMKSMGEKGRIYVANKYNWSIIGPKLINMYKEAIDNAINMRISRPKRIRSVSRDSRSPYNILTIGSSSMIFRYSHKKRHRVASELIRMNECKSLLDIGTGDAELLAQLNARYGDKEYVGYEPEEVMRNNAIEQVLGTNIAIIGEMSELKDKTFDVITIFEVLEHLNIHNQRSVITKANGHLSEGGRLIISVPLESGLSSLIKNALRIAARRTHPLTSFGNIIRTTCGFPVKGRKELEDTGEYVPSHLGFYYKNLERVFTDLNFSIIEKRYSPVKWFGPILNSQVFYVLKCASHEKC